MSELENSVKDTLGPMILEHKPTKLDKDLQTAIAFWAIKTMLVIQHVFPTDSRLIPTADYLALYERKAPLPNYVVFLGFRENFPRDNGSLVATHQIEQLRSVESHISAADNIRQQISAGKKVYGGSLVIGYVAFHIIGHNLGDTNINVPPLETFELPISPYSHDFNWPATFPIELMGGLDAYRAVFNPPE